MAKRIKFEYLGELRSLNEISKLSGIKYKTLWNRVFVQGLSVEEAVDKILYTKKVSSNEDDPESAGRYSMKKTYSVPGFTGTLSELADYFGININTLRSRLRAGWSLKQSLTEPVNKDKATANPTVYEIGKFKGDLKSINLRFGTSIACGGFTFEESRRRIYRNLQKSQSTKFYSIGEYSGTARAISQDFGVSYYGFVEYSRKEDFNAYDYVKSIYSERNSDLDAKIAELIGA